MLDLKFYNNDVGTYVDTHGVGADNAYAKSIEVVGGKVVKYMLTERGSDPMDPEYGGISMHHVQISQAYMPKLRLEVLDDLERCMKYINQGESDGENIDEKLYSLVLKDITYNVGNSRVDVYIEIITNTGKKSVVTINSKTDS